MGNKEPSNREEGPLRKPTPRDPLVIVCSRKPWDTIPGTICASHLWPRVQLSEPGKDRRHDPPSSEMLRSLSIAAADGLPLVVLGHGEIECVSARRARAMHTGPG